MSPTIDGRDPSESPLHRADGLPPVRRRPIILVVDDEPEVLQSVHDLLRLDYQVVGRTNGEEALDFLTASPDVAAILSDQRMPGLSGVEVLRRAAEIRPETTRLLITAFADLRTVIDAVNQGNVFRYVAKPWDPDDLRLALSQAVERRDLMVEKRRLTAELQAANARLTESDRLKTAFLEVASHELNTPVTVILGLAELWRLSQGPTATPAERDWIDRINNAASRLARIVARMFRLVVDDDFAHALAVETVHVGTLVRAALEVLAPYLEARKQIVMVDVPDDLQPIACDPSKIHDVLVNLAANAIKFTPDGKTIAVSARDEADGVRVEVRDQGTGFGPEEQRYLFEPFFTGFDTLHHSSGDYQFNKRGIGLGLCLVRSFVELHGGRVEVSSTPGVGSTFAFTLPRRPK